MTRAIIKWMGSGAWGRPGVGNMDRDIRASIAAALDRRRAQREPIGRLQTAWLALTESVETLVATLGETGTRFAALRQPAAEQATVAREIEAEPGAAEIRDLRQAIAALTPDLTAIRNRIDRDTVNIGVIGRAKAGKSTLLRTITDLGEETIPSTALNPTTAARSRILHSPGRADAEITLHTWEEFRDGYLAPLHRDAGCKGPVPQTPDAFAGHNYEDLRKLSRQETGDEGLLSKQKFLERLHNAQDSFASYRPLLTGPERKLTIEELGELRPYVAYPLDAADGQRPYHAVRDIRIYCAFPEVDVENLMLVDLPGAGEAGLDIDRQFLQDLKNEVDVLLQVKRPGPNDAYFGDADWEVLDLANEARMGVDKHDFVGVVVNTDPAHLGPAYVTNAIEQTLKITERNNLRLLVGDVANAAEVREQILGPVLQGLADRLAVMDHAAASAALTRAADVAKRAMALSDRLARQARRWGALVPDEDQALGAKAKELRNEVARALDSLRKEYDQRVQDGEVVKEIDEGITHAKHRLLEWAGAGFGYGDQRQWHAVIEPSMVADPGETRDDQCTLARQKIREEFSRVDGSIATAVGRLQDAVAGILRQHLSDALVPAGEQPLQALVQQVQQQRLETLRSAIQELVEFRTYGNIFLRVGRPILSEISAAQLHAPAPADETAPGAALGGAPGKRPARGGLWKEGVKNIGRVAGGPAVDAALMAVDVATTAAPAIAGMIGNASPSDDSAAGLHAALTAAFRHAVDEIEEHMREEAQGLTEVLASVMDQFFDRFAHTPGVEEEFERLCGPVRRELWRDTFDGRTADLATALDHVAKAAAGTDEAGRQIRAIAADFGVR
jgi:hypothetical protein